MQDKFFVVADLLLVLVFDESGNEIGLRFFIISGWGGKATPPFTTHTQMKVGKSMAELAEQYDSSFFVSLGDNFLDQGIRSVDDSRFEVMLAIGWG